MNAKSKAREFSTVSPNPYKQSNVKGFAKQVSFEPKMK